MICSYGSVIRLVDAFHGTPLQTFAGHVNSQKLHLEATFSPDSQFVFSGSGDGVIHVWNAESGYKVCDSIFPIYKQLCIQTWNVELLKSLSKFAGFCSQWRPSWSSTMYPI